MERPTMLFPRRVEPKPDGSLDLFFNNNPTQTFATIDKTGKKRNKMPLVKALNIDKPVYVAPSPPGFQYWPRRFGKPELAFEKLDKEMQAKALEFAERRDRLNRLEREANRLARQPLIKMGLWMGTGLGFGALLVGALYLSNGQSMFQGTAAGQTKEGKEK